MVCIVHTLICRALQAVIRIVHVLVDFMLRVKPTVASLTSEARRLVVRIVHVCVGCSVIRVVHMLIDCKLRVKPAARKFCSGIQLLQFVLPRFPADSWVSAEIRQRPRRSNSWQERAPSYACPLQLRVYPQVLAGEHVVRLDH